jgi:hypothetical protein
MSPLLLPVVKDTRLLVSPLRIPTRAATSATASEALRSSYITFAALRLVVACTFYRWSPLSQDLAPFEAGALSGIVSILAA